MINAYGWSEYILLVGFKIAGVGEIGILCYGVDQEDVMEYIIENWNEGREITQMTVTSLTEDAAAILHPMFERRGRVLEGD